ncbi:hypothetical protein DFJ67_0568 [Asanoa ferruginea]|uniref:Uncharacterized protein n=1 Tax=Asanoa ferruginea TaxID=53367 RepID=A0A3D9ZB52_9ACTN|nr:hypothetical protein [Asanoa ferruginea]REF94628.1 hypothetical protein DFJ67_0568 [Asanoa ferruginea]GIF50820.1 hypothetical protein Afe04nite_53590 [Asanoa ferruginea]
MSLHLSTARGAARRVVLSCDVAGCPVQVEPPPIESWRNDADARAWARDHAEGWIHDPVRQTDYCPTHAAFGTAPAAGVVPPRPTTAARDQAGNPLDRDDYAERLRRRLAEGGATEVAARLLDELAAIYRGETIGALAHDVAALLERSDHR